MLNFYGEVQAGAAGERCGRGRFNLCDE